MSENTQAAEAPANAVEASQANSQSENSSNEPSQAGGQNSSGAAAPTTESGASGAEEHAGDEAEGGDEGHEGEEAAAGEAGEAGAADPNRKKRRRRRKKKGGKPGEPGAQAAPPTGEGGGEERAHGKPPREGSGGVFARFFDGAHANKRHAFSAGEVVAGRVVRVNGGAFAVDLFGKATAFVDIFEPHEVPVMPEPPPEAPKAEGAAPVEGVEASPAATGEATEGAPAAVEGESAVQAVAAATPVLEAAASVDQA